MIYLDDFIIINFFIDFIVIYTCSSILKINVRKYRILLSCLIGELSIISLFVSMNNYLLLFFKLLLCMIMILVSFGYNDYKSFVKNTIYYYILNFLVGGVLYYFKNNGLINYLYYLLLIPVFMKIYKYFAYNLKNNLSLRHKVTIYLNNGKTLYLNGYMDSGNELIEPFTNRKVIIINKKDLKENYYFVPYKTIDNSSLIRCFNPKKVYIDGLGERNDISVGVINKKFKGFNCLLNYKLLEDK